MGNREEWGWWGSRLKGLLGKGGGGPRGSEEKGLSVRSRQIAEGTNKSVSSRQTRRGEFRVNCFPRSPPSRSLFSPCLFGFSRHRPEEIHWCRRGSDDLNLGYLPARRSTLLDFGLPFTSLSLSLSVCLSLS